MIRAASGGIGMGASLAIAISYTHYQSILWAMVHGLCGWGYVIYFAVYGVVA